MKKSLAQLRGDIARANKQIKLGKESGNKRQLNRGRQARLAAWEAIRDKYPQEYAKTAPQHIAKALGAPKKKETPEFKKPREEKPKRDVVMVSETEMDFTRLPKKELEKLLEQDAQFARAQEMAAKKKPVKVGVKTASKKKETKPRAQARTAPKVSSPELRAEVRSWLNSFPEYKKLAAKAQHHKSEAERFSGLAQDLARAGVRGERLNEVIDKLYENRHKHIETRRAMVKFMEAHEDEFKDDSAFDSQVVAAYTDYAMRFDYATDLKMFDPFTPAEDRMMARIEYDYHRPKGAQAEAKKVKVKGKSQLQRELKKRLLKQAEELLEDLDSTQEEAEENRETLRELEKAASSPEVEYGEMLALSIGEKDEDVELAFLAETVDDLSRAVVARAPPRVAAAKRKKKKKPVRLARLDKKRKDKEV